LLKDEYLALLKLSKEPNWDLHHIIAKGDIRAGAALAILGSLDISRNNTANLVLLPSTKLDGQELGVPHVPHHGAGIHSNTYYSATNRMIINAAISGGREAVISIMTSMNIMLQKGITWW
jgi:hypothetical protein